MGFEYPDEKDDMMVNEYGVTVEIPLEIFTTKVTKKAQAAKGMAAQGAGLPMVDDVDRPKTPETAPTGGMASVDENRLVADDGDENRT